MKINDFKLIKCYNTKANQTFRNKIKMPKDTFEKSQIKPFVIDSSIHFENEGFISFYPKNDSENILIAKFNIDKPEQAPLYSVGNNIDGKFELRNIVSVQKSKDESTYISQSDDAVDEKNTRVSGKIINKIDDGAYEVKVDNFPKNIIIRDSSIKDLEIGSYALFLGSLIYEE